MADKTKPEIMSVEHKASNDLNRQKTRAFLDNLSNLRAEFAMRVHDTISHFMDYNDTSAMAELYAGLKRANAKTYVQHFQTCAMAIVGVTFQKDDRAPQGYKGKTTKVTKTIGQAIQKTYLRWLRSNEVSKVITAHQNKTENAKRQAEQAKANPEKPTMEQVTTAYAKAEELRGKADSISKEIEDFEKDTAIDEKEKETLLTELRGDRDKAVAEAVAAEQEAERLKADAADKVDGSGLPDNVVSFRAALLSLDPQLEYQKHLMMLARLLTDIQDMSDEGERDEVLTVIDKGIQEFVDQALAYKDSLSQAKTKMAGKVKTV